MKPSSHVGFGLAMPNRSPIRRAGNLHFPCRRSSMPVTTPSPVTSTIPSILPSLTISRRLRRPQSPFPRLFEFGGGASSERDGEYSGSARSTALYSCRQRLPNRNVVDSRGHLFFLFSGTGWVWGMLWVPPPHFGPAVHSNGCTALHLAALFGNCRIVRLLIASKAAVDAPNDGYAVPLLPRRIWRPSLRHLPCRATPLHWAARFGHTGAIAELLMRGAAVAVQDCNG